MVYNAHTALKEYWTYEELGNMPLRDLTDELEFFMPKLKEIAERRQAKQLEAELTGQRNGIRPGMRGR